MGKSTPSLERATALGWAFYETGIPAQIEKERSVRFASQGIVYIINMIPFSEVVLKAVLDGDLDSVVTALRNKRVAPSSLDASGCSLLHWASVNNRISIATALLDHSAEVNLAGGVRGESPLQWAIRQKYYAMIQLLISRGADLSFRSAEGLDALHLVTRLGNMNTLYFVLHHGADPNSVDGRGDTPIAWLIKNRQGKSLLRPLRLLLRFGASVSHTDPITQNNALHLAVLAADMDFRSALLLHQADVNVIVAKNTAGLTPWNLATHRTNRKMTKFLFDALHFGLAPFHSVTFSAVAAA